MGPPTVKLMIWLGMAWMMICLANGESIANCLRGRTKRVLGGNVTESPKAPPLGYERRCRPLDLLPSLPLFIIQGYCKIVGYDDDKLKFVVAELYDNSVDKMLKGRSCADFLPPPPPATTTTTSVAIWNGEKEKKSVFFSSNGESIADCLRGRTKRVLGGNVTESPKAPPLGYERRCRPLDLLYSAPPSLPLFIIQGYCEIVGYDDDKLKFVVAELYYSSVDKMLKGRSCADFLPPPPPATTTTTTTTPVAIWNGEKDKKSVFFSSEV